MVEFPKEYRALMNTKMEVSLQSFSQVEKDRTSHGSDGNEGEKRQGSGKRSSNGAFQEQNNEGEQVSPKDNMHSVESNDTKTSEHSGEASQRMREQPETVGSKCGIGAQEANMEAIELKRVNGKVGLNLKKVPGRPYYIHSVARSTMTEQIVEAGDYVHSIDGNRIEFLDAEVVENMLKGQTGSSLSLLISRNDFVETTCLSSSFGLGLAMDEVESSSKTRRIKKLVVSDVASLSSLRNLIKKGDEITQFDGRAVSEMGSAEIAAFVAGEKGSKISITYRQARTK
ncbi:hypothetical protein GUITHDRAFT_101709 [Guillardia theta CCMP2712]|uniref:PDZ domain-containing protein n=1 Tax=Guillardia theta (strain CCMP2712) TaxID=905079 RepID=L1JVY1_GUITC|nr:hypothetical protein GUITHDRAFT_101709 [Guillardia theta CCMP2712]EKX52542.1 hypothetical protein GUITHDRAFT_101709 [Guillardia theta CCMP2712]|eukprot:XP_005839522.1 hypothetical protein GUITHDRAFT_101709 [Guillardia theta CCMP2712]